MNCEKSIDIVVRPKRQVTIPWAVCEKLGIGIGDILELSIEGSTLIAKPRKAAAIQALKEIRAAFESSGISEIELASAARESREQLAGEHHASKA
jgi:bifunctional DNA-binding transcriptional regulator/antitoxin component of YhaV-PrlF toxin-antitoxin module